jgi:lipopolysaccharide export system protein LptA
VLGFAFYFIAPAESPFFTDEKMEKIAEFKNTRISGRKEGKQVWEFFAQEGWTDKDREINYLIEVSKGNIYQDGGLVVSNLVAPRVKAYRSSEIVEAWGHKDDEKKGKSLLRAYLDLGRISDPNKNRREEWTKLIADFLKYIPSQKRSEIHGDVELHKKDSLIYAQKIIIDHENKFADITEKIYLKRADGILRSKKLQYFSKEERLEADGKVDLKIDEGGLKTEIEADHSSFYTDIERDMKLRGNIKVAQGKKLAVARSGIYSQREKELFLKGNVKTILEKADVILKEKTVRQLKNKEAKDILKEKTILTSDELIFSTKTGDAQAVGNVFVTQKGREAKANEAVYDDKNELLTLSGDAFMKQEGEWVSARKIIVSVKDETFDAEGAVEAQITL